MDFRDFFSRSTKVAKNLRLIAWIILEKLLKNIFSRIIQTINRGFLATISSTIIQAIKREVDCFGTPWRKSLKKSFIEGLHKVHKYILLKSTLVIPKKYF